MKKFEPLDLQGWLPGPKEKEKEYLARIEQLRAFNSSPPPYIDHFLTDRDLAPALQRTKELFHIHPDWVVTFYSNAHLSFFQGGATWITEKKEQNIPVIQLKESLERGSLWKLYRREEILAHELIHAARMEFQEPYFEEILAYRTSTSRWRRFLGPLFQSQWEAYLFLLTLLVPIAFNISFFFTTYFENMYFLSYLPALVFGILFIRLCFLQATMHLCVRRLAHFLKDPAKRWAVALRLVDKEIFQFAFSSTKQLHLTIDKEHSFRFAMLKKLYFLPN